MEYNRNILIIQQHTDIKNELILFYIKFIWIKMNQNQSITKINLEVITEQLFCPITYQIMNDPVTIESGHTFQRKAIQNWIRRGNRKNPVTGQIMKSTALFPNKGIKNLIEKIPRIESRIRKQTMSLETRLKDLQDLWSQANISDTTIRRQKVKLGAQNDILKTENEKLKEEQNQLKQKLQIMQNQCKQLQGQMKLAKVKFGKQLNLKNKEVNQLKLANQKAKKQNENFSRQIRIIRSQLVKKDTELKKQKQSYELKIKQLQRKTRSISRNNSRDTPTPILNLSREKCIKVLSKQKLSNPETIRPLISPKNPPILLNNSNNYSQRKFESPNLKNYSLNGSQKIEIKFSSSKQKLDASYQPSKWNKSPSNKSLEKRPSIRELLNMQKNDLNKN